MTAAERAFEEWACTDAPNEWWVPQYAEVVWRAACEWRAKRDALFADVFDKKLGDRIRLDARIE